MENQLIKTADSYIAGIYKKEVSAEYEYHNYKHTEKVVAALQKLLTESSLSEQEEEDLILAALFHDVGFVNGQVGHEVMSAQMAEEWLQKNNHPADRIDLIKSLIIVTTKGKTPNTELEKLIKDADLSGLAYSGYLYESESLRKEWQNTTGKKIKDVDWHIMNERFMKETNYHSAAGQSLFTKGKNNNRSILKKKIKILSAQKQSISDNKAAQTQFKTALRNHIDLSAIADNKANIMLSVNALIITVAMPIIVRQVMQYRELGIPALILLSVCVCSMVFATLATRPIKMNGSIPESDIRDKKSNLFFFGNFYKMNYSEFEKGIDIILSEPELLDDSITRDLYFLGRSLGSKYNRLRLCYNIFMYGMIISVIAFIIAFLLI